MQKNVPVNWWEIPRGCIEETTDRRELSHMDEDGLLLSTDSLSYIELIHRNSCPPMDQTFQRIDGFT